MRLIGMVGIVGLLIGAYSPANGQTTTKLCIPTTGANGMPGCADVSAANPLPTDAAFSGSVNVGAQDGSAFAAGTTVVPNGGFFQTTATDNPLTNGKFGAWQMTAQRAGFVNLRNASGTELGVAAAPLQISLANTGANATAIKVDGSAATQPVSGTVTASVAAVAPAASDGVTSKVLKASAGTLYSFHVDNYAAANGFAIAYNATAAPAPGAITAANVLACVPLPSSGSAALSYGGGPPGTFGTGIVILLSSATDCQHYTTGTITGYISGQAS